MGVEQGPKPLGELRSRLERFNRAASRVDGMIKDPGGESWPQRLNLADVSNPEKWLETAVKVGNITASLKAKTQPIIIERRYAIYGEIRISQAEENARRIAELVESGVYGARGEEILARAEENLRILKGDEKPQATQSTQEEEGDRSGALQIDWVSPQFISVDGLRRRPSEQKSGEDQFAQEVFQTDRIYGSGDIIKEVRRINPGISEGAVQVRVCRAIKKDPSLGPSNVPHRGRGGGRLFTGAVARRLVEEALNPVDKRHRGKTPQGPRRSKEHGVAEDPGEEPDATDSSLPGPTATPDTKVSRAPAPKGRILLVGHDGNQNKVSQEHRGQAIRELGIELTRTVLSPLTAEFFGEELFRKLPKNALALARPYLPQGRDLESIIEIHSPEELKNFVVGLMVGVVEEFWDTDADGKQLIGARRIVSVKEKQIIDYCARLKEKGYDVPDVIGKICDHFSILLPEKYREVRPTLNNTEVRFDDGSNSEDRMRRRGARGTNWDRLGEKKGKNPYIPPQGRIPGRGHTRGFRRR